MEKEEKFFRNYITVEYRKEEVIKIFLKITERYFKTLDYLKELDFLFGDSNTHYIQKKRVDSAFREYKEILSMINNFTPYKIDGAIDNWNRMTHNHTLFNANFESLCVTFKIMNNAIDQGLPFHQEEIKENLFD